MRPKDVFLRHPMAKAYADWVTTEIWEVAETAAMAELAIALASNPSDANSSAKLSGARMAFTLLRSLPDPSLPHTPPTKHLKL